jgi:RNA polymerase-binding transcription factor DksA
METEQARERLIAERDRLIEVRDAASRLSASSKQAGAGEQANPDQLPAEQANETIERELDLGVLLSVDRELAQLQRALGRLDAGTYGRCEVCGKPIAEGRLEAKPAARYCVEDQAKAEKDPLLRG